MKINEYQNQINNQKNINDNLLKQSKKQIKIEKGYIEMINKKDEEIKKLKEDNFKLNNTLEQMKTDIERVNIEKNKAKELKDLRDEIGVIEIIDVNKFLNINKKFSIESLKFQRGIEHFYIGNKINNNNNVQETEIKIDKNENPKKSKKKKIIKKKEGEQNSGNTKLCKK